MNELKVAIYKAALLHDVGKFRQRTEHYLKFKEHPLLSQRFVEKCFRSSEESNLVEFIVSCHHAEILKLAAFLVETAKNQNGYLQSTGEVLGALQKTPLWEELKKKYRKDEEKSTAKATKQLKWIATQLDEWQQIVGNKGEFTKQLQIGLRLAEIVCEADNMASGEREPDSVYLDRPLESIFNQVNIGKEFGADKNKTQPIGRLRPDHHFRFPQSFESGNIEHEESLTVRYSGQWREFLSETDELPVLHQDTLLFLYKKYLWCIPSAYFGSRPDISLYEHSRLTAAIAVALFDHLTDIQGSDLLNWPPFEYKAFRQKQSFLLLCAELSGIQKYIYNIAHSGAMRALKGRSFWLQQIVDSVAGHILEQLDLPLANLIFSGGGKLILLLPDTDFIKKALPEIQTKIENKVFEEYDGNISLVFGDIALQGGDFFGRKISRKWDGLYKEVEKNKARKLSAHFDAGFFEPQDLYGAILQCRATKREICIKMPETEAVYREDDKRIGIVPFNEFHFPVGNQKIVKAYQVFNKETPPQPTEDFICEEQFNSQRIGYEIRRNCLGIVETAKGFKVLDDIATIDFYKVGKSITNPRRLLLFNDDDFLNKKLLESNIPKGWKFYGGDWVPLNEREETREFEEIIADAMGIERLGVLRMDIDNLGEVFKEGLGDNATFSRIVQLSTMLDFFFSSYLNCLKNMYWTVKQGIVRQNELTEAEAQVLDDETDKSVIPLRDILQIVYAGGDDLFLVSVWNVLPDLAWWINERFKEFTCGNPNFTLSAGISLFDNKYPIYKAAKYAGQALDDAKSKWKDKHGAEHEKGRISFLGKAMSWRDFEISRHLAKELYGTNGKLKRGLVNRLEEMYGNYYAVKQQLKWLKKYEPDRARPFKSAEWSTWRWRGCYTLHRFAEQQGREKAGYIKQLATDIFLDSYHLDDTQSSVRTDANFIAFLDVPVRWADLLIRIKK